MIFKNFLNSHIFIQFSFNLIEKPKVRSSYGLLAYFSDIFISGKNVVISVREKTTFLLEIKISEKCESGP